MKPVVCLLICLVGALLFGGTASNKIILTQADIESAGHFRISDLLQSHSANNFSTHHGFLNYFSFNGLESYQHQTYNILINGHEMNMNFLGAKCINSLPIDLNNLDSIKIILSPHYQSGQIRNAGTISFHTHQPQDNTNYLKNMIILGNESKDPGPYRFTSKTSPNVDKAGTDYSGSFGYNFLRHQLSAAFHYRQHIYTDWSTRNRIRQIKTEKQWPMLIEYGGSLYSRGTLLNNQYSFLLSSLKTDNMYLYYEPGGHEFPLDYYNNYLGFTLNRDISRCLAINFNLDYETQYTDNKLRTGIRENQSGLETSQSTLEFQFKKQSVLKKAGFHLRTEKLLSSINTTRENRVIPGGFLDFKFNLPGVGQVNISEIIKLYQDEIYDQFLLSIQNQVGSKTDYNLVLSSGRNIFHYTINDLWLQRNYLSPQINISTKQGQNRKYTADLNVNHDWNRDFSIKMNLFTRYFQDYNFFTYDFHFNPSEFSFYSPTVLNQPADGFLQGLTALLQWQQSVALRSKLAITLQKSHGNTHGFTNAWSRIPKFLINYQLLYRPNSGFSMQIVLQHASQTRWPDYENITGIEYFSTFRESYRYNHHLDSRNRIDINIRKDIWDRKLTLKFMLRNITDQKIYYSPVGASFDMSLFVGVGYNFN
ncbi:MAG: TonB-dependent receptor plug domain-containing protein [Fidelibacterota bacterium]